MIRIGPTNFKLIIQSDVPVSEIPEMIAKCNKVIEIMSKELENRGTAYFGGRAEPFQND